jgi:hypothetical protein
MGYGGVTTDALPNTDTLGLHMTLLRWASVLPWLVCCGRNIDIFNRPTSKGNLLLKSSDPFEHPLINPK